jgi:PIN domain nuclease of toxin-antitoxin system
MEPIIHLDTHVVAWLYAGDQNRLDPVWDRVTKSQLVISPMVLLELQYFYETGKVAQPVAEVWPELVRRLGLRLSTLSWNRVVECALALSWTRDPFDRLIVAHAMAENAPLITKDVKIREQFHGAVWG